MKRIRIKSLDQVDGDTDFIPEQEKLTNTANVSMHSIYIQTPLDPEFETSKEAMSVKQCKNKRMLL